MHNNEQSLPETADEWFIAPNLFCSPGEEESRVTPRV